MFVDEKMVRKMKETYPAGTRIVLDRMGYDPRPIEPGTKGTVRHVDDMGTGGHRPPLLFPNQLDEFKFVEFHTASGY